MVRSLGSFEGNDVSAKTDFALPSGDRGGYPTKGARVNYCAKTPSIVLRSTRILMMESLNSRMIWEDSFQAALMVVLVIEVTIQINCTPNFFPRRFLPLLTLEKITRWWASKPLSLVRAGFDAKTTRLSSAIRFVVRLARVSDHFPQFPFLRKLAAEDTEIAHQVLASLHECLTRSERAVGLNAKDVLPNILSNASSSRGF